MLLRVAAARLARQPRPPAPNQARAAAASAVPTGDRHRCSTGRIVTIACRLDLTAARLDGSALGPATEPARQLPVASRAPGCWPSRCPSTSRRLARRGGLRAAAAGGAGSAAGPRRLKPQVAAGAVQGARHAGRRAGHFCSGRAAPPAAHDMGACISNGSSAGAGAGQRPGEVHVPASAQMYRGLCKGRQPAAPWDVGAGAVQRPHVKRHDNAGSSPRRPVQHGSNLHGCCAAGLHQPHHASRVAHAAAAADAVQHPGARHVGAARLRAGAGWPQGRDRGRVHCRRGGAAVCARLETRGGTDWRARKLPMQPMQPATARMLMCTAACIASA